MAWAVFVVPRMRRALMAKVAQGGHGTGIVASGVLRPVFILGDVAGPTAGCPRSTNGAGSTSRDLLRRLRRQPG